MTAFLVTLIYIAIVLVIAGVVFKFIPDLGPNVKAILWAVVVVICLVFLARAIPAL